MNEILLNMIPNSCAPEVHLSQYDNGRVLRFVLKEGNAEYQAPSGAVVKVKATKPSGLGFVVSGTISDGNIVTVTNTETMTNEAGRFPAELSITSGSTLLGTSNFVFNIERSPHPEGTIDGDAETLLPELTLLVERIEDSNARIESMTASATTLATGEDATAEYDSVNNQLVLGLPRGERGEQGEGVASLEPRVLRNENAIDVLDARMDTFASLPEGSTTGDAELIDIRVGADGVVYPTAGDSVRTQFNYKLPINAKSVESSVLQETEIDFPNVGILDYRNGILLDTETAYSTTDYIDLTDITGIYRTGTTIRFALWTYCFYDSDKVFLGYKGSGATDYVDYTIESYNGKEVTWLDIDDFPTAKYVRISKDNSRPFTYYSVIDRATYSYDIPNITINNVKPLKFRGKTIVNFGDSLFGNYRDTNNTTDKSISKMIADATGATVYNCGFGGCRMAIHSAPWNAFSMYELANAIATNTWTLQDSAIQNMPADMPTYFAETLALLKSIDFSKVDYITIGYGTNDYTGDIFLTGEEASFENETDYFKGALEYSIRTILNTYPNIRLAVISPCWRWFLSDGVYSYSSDDPQSRNSRGYMLTDYVDMCKTVCESMHVAYIDTYYTLGLNEWTHLEYFPANDGTHLNEKGRELRTDRIVGQLESLY